METQPASLEPAIATPAPATRAHRVWRLAAIGSLLVTALASAALIAWLLYTRSTWTFQYGFVDPARPEQSVLGRGLRIITQHKHFIPAIVGAAVATVIALVLVFAMMRRARWAYLVTAIASAATIAAPWVVRSEVWDIEAGYARSGRWAARSPYVAAATNLSVGATLVLAVIAICAAGAFITSRKRA